MESSVNVKNVYINYGKTNQEPLENVSLEVAKKYHDGGQWTWFIFPWNVYEDVTNLTSKINFSSRSVEEIGALLREHYGLMVDNTTLGKVLSQMSITGKIKENGGKYGTE